MRWRTNVRIVAGSGACVALLLIGGCSAAPPESAPPTATSGTTNAATATTSGSGQAPAGSGVDNGGDKQAANQGNNDGGSFSWVPPGPVDPSDPQQARWYASLQNKDCAGLSATLSPDNANTPDGFALWGAAAALCRAVYQHDASGWTEAATGLSALARPDAERCLDRAAYDLVAALVAFHAQNPTSTPSPGVGSGFACPLGLTGLDALDTFGDFGVPGPTSTPSSGLDGGRFQLVGRFLDVASVLIDGQPVGVEAQQTGGWVVLIPPAAAAGQVQVTATGSAGPIPGSLTFTYHDDSLDPAQPEATNDPGTGTGGDTGGDPGTTEEIPTSAPETTGGGN